jgi:hypothetical protein
MHSSAVGVLRRRGISVSPAILRATHRHEWFRGRPVMPRSHTPCSERGRRRDSPNGSTFPLPRSARWCSRSRGKLPLWPREVATLIFIVSVSESKPRRLLAFLGWSCDIICVINSGIGAALSMRPHASMIAQGNEGACGLQEEGLTCGLCWAVTAAGERMCLVKLGRWRERGRLG